MRVLVAGRLSRKAGDRDQTGFDSQEREAARWAQAQGHEVVAVVADFKTGRAGLSARPNLRPWVTDPAMLVRYDGIVTLKLDRLTRGDSKETADLEEWAREHDKTLLTTEGLVFPCEGADGIRWDLAKRLAHDEWLRISERYTRMQRELRAQGSLVGRNPYGYRVVADGTRKTLAPEPAEAQVIRDAADWYLAGASLDVICERLNRAGRLPRRMKDGRQSRWAAKTISGVLRNEVLVGRQKDAHGRTILKVPPILPRKTWEALIARMDQRANRKGISQSKTPALLTSIIACSKCDRNMYRTGSSSYRGYYCRTCGAYIRLELADQLVHDAMAADNRRDAIEVVVAGSTHEDEIAEVKRDMAEAVEAEDFERLSALRAELDRLRSLPSEPPRVERRLSDQTVAEMWAALPDDAARRHYLLHRDARALYEDGWLTANLGTLDRPRQHRARPSRRVGGPR